MGFPGFSPQTPLGKLPGEIGELRRMSARTAVSLLQLESIELVLLHAIATREQGAG